METYIIYIAYFATAIALTTGATSTVVATTTVTLANTVTVGREVRLVGGSRPSEGRVEVFLLGQWGTVCDDNWDTNDTIVVCRQLGYNVTNPQAFSGARFQQGTGPILMDEVNCTGQENELATCPRGAGHDCDHSEDASVDCDTACSLAPCVSTVIFGPSSWEGRISSLAPPITCSAVCNPSCTYTWTRDIDGAVMSHTHVLSLGILTDDDNGGYTCKAKATDAVGSFAWRSISIVISAAVTGSTNAPDKACSPAPCVDTLKLILSSLGGTYVSPITCSAICNASCTYTWTKDGVLMSDTKVISIGALTDDTYGEYTCTANATDGFGSFASKSKSINFRAPVTSSTKAPSNGVAPRPAGGMMLLTIAVVYIYIIVWSD